MKYPIGLQSFENLITDNYVYVDKTEYVYNLAQEHICFLSRPRRFGKSLLISTLEAYFQGRKELFRGLAIEKLEEKWEEYPVFRIDFANESYEHSDELITKLESYLDDWEARYGVERKKKLLGDRFQAVLEQAYLKTGKKAIVLVDEYDRPLLDALGEETEKRNRSILKGFYGTFKTADDSLRFVFMTGVTKFAQITVFSGLNQPNDISMDSRYDAICGITEAELESVFSLAIRSMASNLDVTYEEMKAMLKKQYDGYHFSSAMKDIYNPYSLINAFSRQEISDYWYQSATPSYLSKLLEGHQVNMQELTSREYPARYFIDYKADAEDPLAMLYQSGYLTIKGYDKWDRVFKLDFPNDEVKSGFSTLMANSYLGTQKGVFDNLILQISRMLRQGDLDGVREAFTGFLSSIPYEANKDVRALDFETHYQYTFYIINRLLSCYITLIEKQNSKGRADIIIESIHDIYIFEFKLDKSADEALRQIEEKQYALPYLNDQRKLHKIGVNISSKSRTVEEWKVI